MKKDKETEWYTFDTTNPRQSIRGNDCVIRSISLATGKTWDDVYNSLCQEGLKQKRMPNDDNVVVSYLNSIGWHKMPQLRKEDGRKYTGKEFAEGYKKGSYIVRMAGHLTCIKDGKIHDIWDCGAKVTGNYYISK